MIINTLPVINRLLLDVGMMIVIHMNYHGVVNYTLNGYRGWELKFHSELVATCFAFYKNVNPMKRPRVYRTLSTSIKSSTATNSHNQ